MCWLGLVVFLIQTMTSFSSDEGAVRDDSEPFGSREGCDKMVAAGLCQSNQALMEAQCPEYCTNTREASPPVEYQSSETLQCQFGFGEDGTCKAPGMQPAMDVSHHGAVRDSADGHKVESDASIREESRSDGEHFDLSALAPHSGSGVNESPSTVATRPAATPAMNGATADEHASRESAADVYMEKVSMPTVVEVSVQDAVPTHDKVSSEAVAEVPLEEVSLPTMDTTREEAHDLSTHGSGSSNAAAELPTQESVSLEAAVEIPSEEVSPSSVIATQEMAADTPVVLTHDAAPVFKTVATHENVLSEEPSDMPREEVVNEHLSSEPLGPTMIEQAAPQMEDPLSRPSAEVSSAEELGSTADSTHTVVPPQGLETTQAPHTDLVAEFGVTPSENERRDAVVEDAYDEQSLASQYGDDSQAQAAALQQRLEVKEREFDALMKRYATLEASMSSEKELLRSEGELALERELEQAAAEMKEEVARVERDAKAAVESARESAEVTMHEEIARARRDSEKAVQLAKESAESALKEEIARLKREAEIAAKIAKESAEAEVRPLPPGQLLHSDWHEVVTALYSLAVSFTAWLSAITGEILESVMRLFRADPPLNIISMFSAGFLALLVVFRALPVGNGNKTVDAAIVAAVAEAVAASHQPPTISQSQGGHVEAAVKHLHAQVQTLAQAQEQTAAELRQATANSAQSMSKLSAALQVFQQERVQIDEEMLLATKEILEWLGDSVGSAGTGSENVITSVSTLHRSYTKDVANTVSLPASVPSEPTDHGAPSGFGTLEDPTWPSVDATAAPSTSESPLPTPNFGISDAMQFGASAIAELPPSQPWDAQMSTAVAGASMPINPEEKGCGGLATPFAALPNHTAEKPQNVPSPNWDLAPQFGDAHIGSGTQMKIEPVPAVGITHVEAVPPANVPLGARASAVASPTIQPPESAASAQEDHARVPSLVAESAPPPPQEHPQTTPSMPIPPGAPAAVQESLPTMPACGAGGPPGSSLTWQAPASGVGPTVDAAGRPQQQEIQAASNPFGNRPQHKEISALTGPFGVRPKQQAIHAASNPFGGGRPQQKEITAASNPFGHR
eukprot:TRINITY_DN67208_c0_g1_i1.p1 TRINITY_DN67208_c0_g1~~TRINITY_DN67208_c0_g1_i1.p1  ORF type:complete len:1085 (-),score=181.40 TRINITY_DN67208_c0_g1_i1:291-3545(-)